jgi:hypothetical protein
MEWTKATYNDQYEKWVPWLEDVYLRWFTKDNKASYATKRTFLSPSTIYCTLTHLRKPRQDQSHRYRAG